MMKKGRKAGILNKAHLIESIIEEAYNIIHNDGYEQLSVRKIANAVGYTAGNLYNLFPSIEYVIIGVNQKVLRNLLVYIEDAIGNSNGYSNLFNAPDRLAILAGAYYEFSQKYFNLWSMVFEKALLKDLLVPMSYKEEINKLYQFVRDIIAEYEQDASIIDIRTMLFWSGVHGIAALNIHNKFSRVSGAPSTALILQYFLQNFCVLYQSKVIL